MYQKFRDNFGQQGRPAWKTIVNIAKKFNKPESLPDIATPTRQSSSNLIVVSAADMKLYQKKTIRGRN